MCTFLKMCAFLTNFSLLKTSCFFRKLGALLEKSSAFLKNFALQKTLRCYKNYAHFGKISLFLEKLCTQKNLALLRKIINHKGKIMRYLQPSASSYCLAWQLWEGFEELQ
jgi:hypothetical protein